MEYECEMLLEGEGCNLELFNSRGTIYVNSGR